MPRRTNKTTAADEQVADGVEYVRVEAQDNLGAEFTIRADELVEGVHIRLEKPALDNHGDPAPPKYPSDLRPATPADPTSNPAGDGAAQQGGTEDGHQAETEGAI